VVFAAVADMDAQWEEFKANGSSLDSCVEFLSLCES